MVCISGNDGLEFKANQTEGSVVNVPLNSPINWLWFKTFGANGPRTAGHRLWNCPCRRVDNLTHRHPYIDNLILLAYACKYVYKFYIYIYKYINMIIYAYTQGFSKSYLVVYLFVFLKIIMFGKNALICGFTTLLPLLTTLVTILKSSHCHGFRNHPLWEHTEKSVVYLFILHVQLNTVKNNIYIICILYYVYHV